MTEPDATDTLGEAAEDARIAIPSLGPTLDDETGSSFGRAPLFCIAQVTPETIEWIPNEASTAPNGAGPGAAQAILDAGARIVVAKQIGPKARQVLEAAHVALYHAEGKTVREVLARYRAGDREPMRDVAAHTGMRNQRGA
jgi:predicted Fe-Mo cluster-binding NifX family protein